VGLAWIDRSFRAIVDEFQEGLLFTDETRTVLLAGSRTTNVLNIVACIDILTRQQVEDVRGRISVHSRNNLEQSAQAMH